MLQPLFLFNTLTRKKSEFTPLKPGEVSLYTCGPTVYDFAHVGNLRTYIFEDLLKRVLQSSGYTVNHIMNITDVGHLVGDSDDGEDKMMKALRRENLPATVDSLYILAGKYTEAFQFDLQRLNILSPDQWLPATKFIPEMIELIKKIEANGFAYQISDGVYFDTAKLADYGIMANLKNTELQAGARVEVNSEKRNPHDFALWIKAVGKNAEHAMTWDSPWGTGFPGWHLECSAMSLAKLGEQFDIHCGGIDHIFPHHTNEIAQNQAAVGTPAAQSWIHGEFLVIDEKRMGKSEGNLLTLQSIIDKGIEPLAYRYFCLQAHYRQKLNFTWEALAAAETALTNLWFAVSQMGIAAEGAGSTGHERQFALAIADDLNLPQALAVVWDLVKDPTIPSGAKKTSLLKFDSVLGLSLHDIQTVVIPEEVKALALQRETARTQKEFATSDQLRNAIDALGFVVDDTPGGSIIKPKKEWLRKK